jgi:hypothetical protein
VEWFRWQKAVQENLLLLLHSWWDVVLETAERLAETPDTTETLPFLIQDGWIIDADVDVDVDVLAECFGACLACLPFLNEKAPFCRHRCKTNQPSFFLTSLLPSFFFPSFLHVDSLHEGWRLVLGLPLVPDAENKNKISRRLPAFRLLG